MLQAISRLRALALVAFASCFLTFSSPSSAAAFQVTFDPYTELYGTAIFNVDESCLAYDNNYNTFKELAWLAKNGCYITFLGAHISTDGIGGEFTNYVAIFPLVIFSSLLVEDHQLSGITTFIPIFLDEVLAAGTALHGSSLTHECHATLSFTAPSWQNPAGGVTFRGCGEDGRLLSPLTGDVISIALIPEPGTLALLFGAGIAGWWVRRRRSAAV